MAEIRTVTTLRSKQVEIQRAIVGYEQRLAQARADLSHVTAAIAIFEATGDRDAMGAYVDIHRIWKRGEMMRLCRGFLESEGPMTTPALAQRVMTASGLDAGDKVLSKVVCHKIVFAMRAQHLRGKVGDAGRIKGARVWACPGANASAQGR
jgi:hypothetical protein